MPPGGGYDVKEDFGTRIGSLEKCWWCWWCCCCCCSGYEDVLYKDFDSARRPDGCDDHRLPS